MSSLVIRNSRWCRWSLFKNILSLFKSIWSKHYKQVSHGATLIFDDVFQSYFSLTHWDLLHFFFNCCCCTEVPNNQMDNHKVHAVDIKWHFLSEVFAKVFLYLLIRRKENWYPVIKMVKWCMWHVPDMWSENRIPAYPHL